MKRFLIPLIAVAVICTGCSTNLTSVQVQDLSYMAGYSTMSAYLIAKKPPVADVASFQAEVQAVESAISTSATSTTTAESINLVIDKFVKDHPSDAQTAMLLKALLPPMIREVQIMIDSYIATQPESEQLKTLQIAAYCALEGVDSACATYIAVQTSPDPVAPPTTLPLNPTPLAPGLLKPNPTATISIART
jgi:hypothetical protein